MALPIFTTDNRILSQMQTQWASQINPILLNPSNSSIVLKNVSLVIGSNTINHRLGENLQGWKIIRQRSAASIYDTQDSNPRPELTLILVSSANVSVDLEVY